MQPTLFDRSPHLSTPYQPTSETSKAAADRAKDFVGEQGAVVLSFILTRGLTGGIDTRGVTLPAALYDWQAALVRWALRNGRAAIFADCGLVVKLRHAASEKAPQNHLRGMRCRVRAIALSVRAWSRAVLLEGVSRRVEATRLQAVLRVVRRRLLPSVWRAGSWCARQSVLLTRVLPNVERGAAHVVSQGWHEAQTSNCHRSDSWSVARAGRSGASHRREQAELPPVKSCRVPVASGTCALPFRGDVRR